MLQYFEGVLKDIHQLFLQCLPSEASVDITESVEYPVYSSSPLRDTISATTVPKVSETIDSQPVSPLSCDSLSNIDEAKVPDNSALCLTISCSVCPYCGDKFHPRKICPANKSYCSQNNSLIGPKSH